MANIGASIELYDKISAPINNMIGAINNMIGAYRSLDSAMDSGFDPGQIHEAEAALVQAKNEVDQIGDYIKENERRQEDFNDEVDKGKDKAGNLASEIMGMAGAFLGLSVLKDQVSQAIEYASNLQEVQNVVDVAFGESSKVIDEWATTTLNSFGLNELSAKKFAGTMGAMLKSSGMSGDEVAEMSMKITELAGDMASFYNLEGEEAFNKLRAGISGETEPLKQLGINMSVANLEAYALSQGISKSYNEMSQAEQVALRYNYILQATQDSQGDFARTSDSFANQQKLLTENWNSFTAQIMSSVLPALSGVMSMLNDTISYLSEHWSVISPILTGILAAIGVLAVAYGIWKIVTLAQAAAQWVQNSALLASPITWIVIAIAAVVGAIVYWISAMGGLKAAWLIVVNAIMTAWDWVKIGFFTGIYWVLDLWNSLQLGMKTAGTAIANFMGDMKASVMMILQNMVNGAIGIINDFINKLNMIPGVSIGTIAEVTFGTNAQLENEAAKQARETELENFRSEVESGKAERAAALEQMKSDAVAATASRQAEISAAQAEAAAGGSSTADSLDGSQMGEDVATTAENTGKAADALSVTNEDLKYMKDLAERDVVNRFTTAEIKVDMTNNNNINGNMDLDGMVEYLVVGVNEAMEKAAEGVHV